MVLMIIAGVVGLILVLKVIGVTSNVRRGARLRREEEGE
jgi:hypothetical protein